MKKILYLFPLLLTGCASIYIPPMASAPLFDEKGETQIELSASTNSLSLNAACAFSEKFGVMIDGSSSYGNYSEYNDLFNKKGDIHPTSVTDPIEQGIYNHNYAEVGFARFDMLNHSVLKLETFVGGGYGRAKDCYEGSYESYKNSYGTAFAQVNFGAKLTNFSAGASTRLSSSFHDYEWNYSTPDLKRNDFVMFHVEPMLFVRAGGKHLKVVTKLGLSFPIKTESFSDLASLVPSAETNTTQAHISLGIHYTF